MQTYIPTPTDLADLRAACDAPTRSSMKFPEEYRFHQPGRGQLYSSNPGDQFGCFFIPTRATGGRAVKVIACDGQETGWDHVSVSLQDRDKCPSWLEMCAVKDLFWDESECVVQFHPAKSDHINFHNGCLHLWRCVNGKFPMPPKICV